jgi:hypothetical protein
MDNESKYAVKILEALATCNSIFTELAAKVRNQANVTRVIHNLECRQYQSEFCIEGYVDAELHDGNAVAWYLEVRWNDEVWVIESRILVNDPQGQYTLKQFPDKIIKTLDEFAEEILKTALDLSNTLDSMDFIGL